MRAASTFLEETCEGDRCLWWFPHTAELLTEIEKVEGFRVDHSPAIPKHLQQRLEPAGDPAQRLQILARVPSDGLMDAATGWRSLGCLEPLIHFTPYLALGRTGRGDTIALHLELVIVQPRAPRAVSLLFLALSLGVADAACPSDHAVDDCDEAT